MKTAMVPGSYDPITLGHIDIIKRTAEIFDRVDVVLTVNLDKKYLLPPEIRLGIIEDIFRGSENVFVSRWDGMLYDYVLEKKPDAVVKGIRNAADFFYELEQNDYNREKCGVNTLFMPASPGMEQISSSLARKLALEGGDLENVLPPAAITAIEKYTNK